MRLLNNNKRLIGFVLCLCLAMTVTGCSKSGKQEESTNVSGLDGVTTDFLDDTVFTVADRRISLTEWYLYAVSETAQIESMYGSDIWDYPVDTDGVTIEEKVRGDIRDQIVYVTTVCSQAERLGVAINEDEQIDINIQCDEFMSKLTAEQIEKYGITSDAVKNVLADNLLAMKVYENLTLNIDTAIPEDEVRHMVLEYIMVPKTYEDEKTGDIVEYSASEQAAMKAEEQEFLDSALASEGIVTLADIANEQYSVVTLVADHDDLLDRFPEELAEIAFSLRQSEITGIFETDAGYFILNCVNRTDEKSTNEARVEIIEARQKVLFEEQYEAWKKEVVVKYNYHLWDEITLHP